MAGTVDSSITRLAELVREAGSVVALTGAGISTPSGIPDFRSPGKGLWENVDPMAVAHIEVFRRDPVRFWSFYGDRFTTLDAVEQIKKVSGAGDLDEGIEAEKVAFGTAFMTEDAKEGISAFLGKRTARWQGK